MSEHITARQVPGYCRGTCDDERSRSILKHATTCKKCQEKIQNYEEKHSPSQRCEAVEMCLGRRTPLCYECKQGSEFVQDMCRIDPPETESVPSPMRRPRIISGPMIFPLTPPWGTSPFGGMPPLGGNMIGLPPSLSDLFTSLGIISSEDEAEMAQITQQSPEDMGPCPDCDPTSTECQQCARNPESRKEEKKKKSKKKVPKE